MKSYPSIPGSKKAPNGQSCIAFYKYDGSNMRWEWSKKRGFHKFGTRTRLFDETDQVFGGAIPMFMDTMAPIIERRILDVSERKLERFTAYTEFLGNSSFAGKHDPDEEKYLKLFDIAIFKKGMMDPFRFVDIFGDLDFTAEVVFKGPMSNSFINTVRTGGYPQLIEGVIAKGGSGHKLWMVKIKTLEYLKKLKVKEKNWQAYWE